MGVRLLISGDDFSDYVVASSREHSICKPVGTLELLLNPSLPRTILTYEPVLFYENDVKVFTGYTGTVAKARMPVSCTVTCYDRLIRAQDCWIDKEYTSHGETIGHWVSKFLSKAGINDVQVDNPAPQPVYPDFSWTFMTALDACIQTLQMSPYQMYCDRNGIVHLTSLYRGAPTKTISEYIEYERVRNDEWIRNRAVVFGVGSIVEDVFESNPYIPAEVRAAVVASGGIYNEVTASDLADRMLDEFRNPLDVKTIKIPGDPTLWIGQTIRFIDSGSDYNELCLITSLTSEYTSSGYTMSVVLDEKCPNLWGWDQPPPTYITLYCGTWGDGVWKTTNSGIGWSPTALRDKYVYDIHVVSEYNVWAACRDGVYSTVNSGDSWVKHTMGVPSGQRDGESYTEANLYWVGVVTENYNSGTVYCLAGSFDNGGMWIYKSTDAGMNWVSERLVQ